MKRQEIGSFAMGTESQFWKMKRVLEMDGGEVTQNVNALNVIHMDT